MRKKRTVDFREPYQAALISVERAAELLGDLSPWTIRKWILEGKILSNKLGRRRLVPLSEIDRLIEESKAGIPRREIA